MCPYSCPLFYVTVWGLRKDIDFFMYDDSLCFFPNIINHTMFFCGQFMRTIPTLEIRPKQNKTKTKKPIVMIIGPSSVMLMHFLKGDLRRDIWLPGNINWTNTLLGHFTALQQSENNSQKTQYGIQLFFFPLLLEMIAPKVRVLLFSKTWASFESHFTVLFEYSTDFLIGSSYPQ